jgi:hypothetical protein
VVPTVPNLNFESKLTELSAVVHRIYRLPIKRLPIFDKSLIENRYSLKEGKIMSTPVSSSAALPITYVFLRILIVVNWLGGIAILVLLLVMPNEQWIMSSFKLSPSPDAERLVMGLRSVAVLGLVAIPINYVVLKRLLAIVETVRSGDPFVAANASRLQAIAWALLALQVISIVIGAIGKAISTAAHPVHLDAGFSINGWLAVLLTFLLAQVFAYGTHMREDLEGVV